VDRFAWQGNLSKWDSTFPTKGLFPTKELDIDRVTTIMAVFIARCYMTFFALCTLFVPQPGFAPNTARGEGQPHHSLFFSYIFVQETK
jgi:hypothetical protein